MITDLTIDTRMNDTMPYTTPEISILEIEIEQGFKATGEEMNDTDYNPGF